MSRLNEDSRVKIPALLHLTRLGYTYLSLKNARWDERNNIFPGLFEDAVLRINPDLRREDVPALLDELHLKLTGEDLGRSFHQRLTARAGVRLIDFENLDNNSWHVVTELPFENGEDNFRPDVTLLVNGRPLAFVEVKKCMSPGGVLEERSRMDRRHANPKFRHFFNLVQLMAFSNNTDASGNVFQLNTEDSITKAGLDSCSSDLFAKGTVFITARGSVGKIAIAGRPMAMNQSCYALAPKVAENYPYVFLHAKTPMHHLKVKASGSTFNSIVTNDIEWTQLIDPRPEVISAFCKVVTPLFERIESAQNESVELTQLRDWLLPLLMPGAGKVRRGDRAFIGLQKRVRLLPWRFCRAGRRDRQRGKNEY